ncbi:MAG: class I adenylate-forming enzyme family protein [Erysipelotrichaceae bacterium]
MIAVERIRNTASVYPDAIALTCHGLHVSYREMLARIDDTARFLVEYGMKRGMRVALILPNIPAFPYFFYACEQLGITPVLIHPLTNGNKMRALCDASRIDLAVMTDVLFPRYRRWMRGHRVVLVSGGDVLPMRFRSLARFAMNFFPISDVIRYPIQLKHDNPIENASDPLDFILFSSGTSGMNKGIRLDFATLDALCDQLTEIIQPIPTKDSMFAILPFFHGFGLGVSLHTVLALGGRCILIPRLARDTIVPEFLKEKPTYIAAVPQLLRLFLKDPRMRNADLSFVRQVFCGGEHVPQSLIEAFDQLLKEGGSKAFVQVGYGCTETLTAACVTRDKQAGVGTPFSGNDIRIVDENDTVLSPLQHGEILIAGPVLMDGYDMQGIADPFVFLDGKKYYRSADIGYLDEEGCLHVLYRKDHLLKINGYFVDPNEIEHAVMTLPFLSEAVALQDEEGRLCLVIATRHEIELDDLKKEITGPFETLDRWYLPKRFYLLKEIPKNEMKKTDRIALKSMINSRRASGLLAEWSL